MNSSKTPPRIPGRAALALTALLLTVPTALKAQDESGAREMISKLEFVTPITKGSGLWALSNRFKASFHEGFAFQARDVTRGDGGRVHWSTRSITAGGEPLTTEFGLRSQHSDWRCDYLHGGGIVESYDVSKAGVEQSFLIPKRPETAGDLVVTGKITTGLKATPVLDQHTAIEFRDHTGQPVTGYGKAFVIDADGRRGEVKTSFDGESLSLRVEGSWLEDAEFPIVIDPLFHTKVLFTAPAGARHHTFSISMGQENVSKSHNVLIAFSIQTQIPFPNSGEQHVLLCNRDFSNPKIVFTFYDSNRGSGQFYRVGPGAVAPVSAARRWIVGIGGPDGLQNKFIYTHEFANLVKSSGTIHEISVPKGHDIVSPLAVGGTSRGSFKDPNFRPGHRALIAFTVRKYLDAPTWPFISYEDRLTYEFFDAKKLEFVSGRFEVEGARRLTRKGCSVNQVNGGASSSPWVVAWTGGGFGVSADKHGVALIKPDGTHKSVIRTMPTPVGDTYVAGSGGRYMTVYPITLGDISLHSTAGIAIQRFDWPATASAPTIMPAVTLEPYDGTYRNAMGIAFNSRTGKQWAITYLELVPYSGFGQRRSTGWVARLDGNGKVQEKQMLWNASGTGSWDVGSAICFDPVSDCFAIAMQRPKTSILGRPEIVGTKLCELTAKQYGFGQGKISATSLSRSSRSYLRVQLEGATSGQPAVLWMGRTRTAQSMEKLGMPGSYLYVDNLIRTFFTSTSRTGHAAVTIPWSNRIPETSYYQWMFDDPAAQTKLKKVTSPGLLVRVGR